MLAFAVGSPVSHREVTKFVACVTTGSEAVSGHRALLYGPLNVIKKREKIDGQGEDFKTPIVLPQGLLLLSVKSGKK